MKKVICIKDYDYYEKGEFYYLKEKYHYSGATYTKYYDVYNMNSVYVSEIGYLVSEVFQDIHERRKEIINSII